LIAAMARDPHRCAHAYNRAVAAYPEARLATLSIRDDDVGLPLWRVRDNGQRIRAYASDAQAWLDLADGNTSAAGMALLPRALFMTAVIRMGLADVFVHGHGGAMYDRAMEQWIAEWQPTPLCPIAVASATLLLPLMDGKDLAMAGSGGLPQAQSRKRRLAHDPESAADPLRRPGAIKRGLLDEINALPRRSIERRRAFQAMHERLAAMRSLHADARAAAADEVARMQRLAADAVTAARRDWAFPLYPAAMLSELVDGIRAPLGGAQGRS
jgi:hypothetical protein